MLLLLFVLVLAGAGVGLYYHLRKTEYLRASPVEMSSQGALGLGLVGEPFNVMVSQKVVDDSFRMFVALDYAMKRAQIPYWGVCGTLLGALRHGGWIPWDFDMDVQVPEDAFRSRLEAFRAAIKEVGFDVALDPIYGNMARVIRPGDGFHSYIVGNMDIFFFDTKTNKEVTYRDESEAPCLAAVSNPMPVEMRPFAPFAAIPFPRDPEGVAERAFGPKWYTKAYLKEEGSYRDENQRTFPLKPKHYKMHLLPSKGFMANAAEPLRKHFASMVALPLILSEMS